MVNSPCIITQLQSPCQKTSLVFTNRNINHLEINDGLLSPMAGSKNQGFFPLLKVFTPALQPGKPLVAPDWAASRWPALAILLAPRVPAYAGLLAPLRGLDQTCFCADPRGPARESPRLCQRTGGRRHLSSERLECSPSRVGCCPGSL